MQATAEQEVPMQATAEHTQALAHVLWLGGTPCSGKTSVAKWLVEHYNAQLYHYDKHERRHAANCLSDQHPEMSAYAAMDMDTRWVHRSVAEMVRATEAAWRERFSMVIDDLLALSRAKPILAEGPGLLPKSVAPFLHRTGQAVWLVPTEAFKRATQPTRGGAPANQTSNPGQAYRNLIDLDLQLAMNVKLRAAELGLTVLEVDGTKSVDAMAAQVADHFGLAGTSV